MPPEGATDLVILTGSHVTIFRDGAFHEIDDASVEQRLTFCVENNFSNFQRQLSKHFEVMQVIGVRTAAANGYTSLAIFNLWIEQPASDFISM